VGFVARISHVGATQATRFRSFAASGLSPGITSQFKRHFSFTESLPQGIASTKMSDNKAHANHIHLHTRTRLSYPNTQMCFRGDDTAIMIGKILAEGDHMRSKSKLLMISLCGAYLVGCDGSSSGGGSSISFEDLCNQGSSLMCEKASSCGYTGSKADCIAQGKALNCSGGPERYCGAGLTYQSSKAPACLDALNALTCSTLDASMPAACAPEVMCTSSSQGGEPTGTFRGEACQAVGVSNSCDPNASVCFAAGTASSCPNGALCVGDRLVPPFARSTRTAHLQALAWSACKTAWFPFSTASASNPV
jgi:hypothetical protein